MTAPSAIFVTLGCRSNQYDTAAMMAWAEEAGYRVRDLSSVPSDEGPVDFYVINTCAVTGKTEYQCRQMIRRARKQSPEAKIVATGCLAETDPHAMIKAGADMVAGPRHRTRVIEYLAGESNPGPGFFYHPAGGTQQKSRAVIKIQDGCMSFCSYCIVPLARGESRSLPVNEVIGQLASLSEKGFAEVVITGVHLGLYGRDIKTSLEELIKRIDRSAGIPERLRLSSLEPQAVSDELINVICNSRLFCPHFHLPLQSGDRQVLKAMKRPYTPERFEEIVRRIHHMAPHAGTGVDIIAGFPGESEQAHENTVKLVSDLPLSYFHVFPYSKRPGTRAAKMTEQVPQDIIKERAARLRKIGADKKREFLRSQVGKVRKVLFEKADESGSSGLSENYVRVETGSRVDCGSITDMKIVKALQTRLEGVPADEE